MVNNDKTDEQDTKDAGATELSDGALEGVSGGWGHSYLYIRGRKCPSCGNETIFREAHMYQ